MDKKNIILIVVIVAVLIVAIGGVTIGFVFYNNKGDSEAEEIATYNLTLEDMYCNIKDSRRIAKIRVTVETNNEETLELLEKNQFLIRDDINKIIRNKEETHLEGKDGQAQLQSEIRNSLVELFDKESITNVYFNDLIIQ